jgi:hypothetical protein
LNFRNNTRVKGCYFSVRFVPPSPFYFGHKSRECIVVPVRYKNKFQIGDIILFDQTAKLKSSYFRRIIKKNKAKCYFKIFEITEQEYWDGVKGPYFVVSLDIEVLNNLEFLSAMDELKNKLKKKR